MNDTALWMALSRVKGVGIVALKTIHAVLTNNNLLLSDIAELPPAQMASETGLSAELCRQIAQLSTTITSAQKDYERIIDSRIEPLLFFDPRYPARFLRAIDYPPALLYLHGNHDLLSSRQLAILSDHNASERGHYIAYHAARISARHSITVTSGMAKGPQTMAHRGAVEGGGNTIAMVPYGLLNLSVPEILKDCIDPARWLFISPFAPHEEYAVHNSYKRNSLIACLVNALVIIETTSGGGCFEAAKSAFNHKTPLFAVEYAHYPETASGNPLIMKDFNAIPIKGRMHNDILLPNMDTCIAKVRYGDGR